METDHRHRFDGKEDRNYHQKPFDENTDPVSQIDDASATLAERRSEKQHAGDPDAAGKGAQAFPNVPDSDASSIRGEERPIDDSARLTQYPEGNDERV